MMFGKKMKLLVLTLGLAMSLGCGGDDTAENENNPKGNNSTSNNMMTSGNNQMTTGNNTMTSDNNTMTSNNNTMTSNNNMTTSNNNMTTSNNTTNTNTNNGMPGTCNASFGMADACGGDPTGSWDLEDICTEPGLIDQINQVCPGSSAQLAIEDVSGTLVFTGGNVAREVKGSLRGTVDLPLTCQALQFVGCAGIGPQVQGFLNGGMVTCAEANGNCECDIDANYEDIGGGTWTNNNDGTLTINDDDAGERDYYFCVESGYLQAKEVMEQGQNPRPEGLATQLYSKGD